MGEALRKQNMNQRWIVETLKNVSLFTDLKDKAEALEYLSGCMKEKSFEGGEIIINQDAMGTDMYVLVSGEISIYKITPEGEKFIVVTLSGNQYPFFGEASLLDNDARSATIIANTDCRCLVFDNQDFGKFCQLYPSWALPVVQRIATVVMKRLRKVNQEFALLYNALVNEIRDS